MTELTSQLGALLFVSQDPVTAEALADHLGITEEKAKDGIKELTEILKGAGLTILKLAGGYQFATARPLRDLAESFSPSLATERVRLSRAAFETLSVIAYNQPVSMSTIEEIRSVRCDRVVDTLIERGLVERFRSGGLGKKSARKYKTTPRFLEIFGLDSIADLPSLEELESDEEMLKESQSNLDELSSFVDDEKEIDEGMSDETE